MILIWYLEWMRGI